MDPSEFFENIAKRNKEYQRLVQKNSPEVGIFWVDLEEKNIPILFSDPTGLFKPKQGIPHITGPHWHSTTWRFFKRNGLLPEKWSTKNYKEVPRGRVLYDLKGKRYKAYATIEMVKSPWLKEAIIKDFNLQKRKIDFIDYTHYEDHNKTDQNKPLD